MSKDIGEEMIKITKYLGLSSDRGEVRDTNFGKILEYLIKNSGENYKQTLAKLANRTRMTIRHIRENTLEGLEYEGIIKVYMENGEKCYKYMGIPEPFPSKALEEKAPEYVKNKKKLLKDRQRRLEEEEKNRKAFEEGILEEGEKEEKEIKEE